eukprot:8399351-Pyramimonas_sp.AAC.1
MEEGTRSSPSAPISFSGLVCPRSLHLPSFFPSRSAEALCFPEVSCPIRSNPFPPPPSPWHRSHVCAD